MCILSTCFSALKPPWLHVVEGVRFKIALLAFKSIHTSQFMS